jgi:hypothetical protein
MLLLLLPLPRVYVCLALALLTLPAIARADAVLLHFYPPAGAVAGYKVYSALQTTGTITSAPIDAGARAPDATGTASYSLAGLDPALSYSVELTAYDARGVESRRSNRVTIGPRVETLGTPIWSSDFNVYAPGVHVPDFVDSSGDTVTATGTDLFFVAYLSDGSRAFGTAADPGAVATRWVGPASDGRGSYEISGRVRSGGLNTQAGIAARVTGNGTRYFALAQSAGGAWVVSGSDEPALTCASGPAMGVTQSLARWYSFKFRVTRSLGLTRLRAKVWLGGTAEPATWQADCWTTLRSTADSGSFALLRGDIGTAYFDDVAVLPVTGTLDPIPPQ